MQTRLNHLYKEFKRLFHSSDRKPDSQSHSSQNSDNDDELRRLGLQLPDYSISGMPDNKPEDDEQPLPPEGSTAGTEKLEEINSESELSDGGTGKRAQAGKIDNTIIRELSTSKLFQLFKSTQEQIERKKLAQELRTFKRLQLLKWAGDYIDSKKGKEKDKDKEQEKEKENGKPCG